MLAAVVAIPNFALANDEDDVRAAVMAMFTAIENQDVDGWIDGWIDAHTKDGTMFGGALAGPMLAPFNNDRETMKANFEQFSPSFSVTVQHLDVKVFGNVAYTTGYLVFNNSTPIAGTAERVRSTMIWVKQGDRWKRDHYHSSPLYPATSR